MAQVQENSRTELNAPSSEPFTLVYPVDMQDLIIFTDFPTKGNPISVFMNHVTLLLIAASLLTILKPSYVSNVLSVVIDIQYFREDTVVQT
jgi:hypothetical protein